MTKLINSNNRDQIETKKKDDQIDIVKQKMSQKNNSTNILTLPKY